MAASKVKLLDFGVRLDLLRRSLFEHPSVVHHGHAFHDAQRDVHVVLDDDEAHMRRERGEDVDEFCPLGRRQPGRRLVEQEETRRASERERHLELALLPIGQFRNQPILDGRQMDRLNEILGGVNERVIAARLNER